MLRRIQSGQAMNNMALGIARLGPEKGLSLFADWTDRIAGKGHRRIGWRDG